MAPGGNVPAVLGALWLYVGPLHIITDRAEWRRFETEFGEFFDFGGDDGESGDGGGGLWQRLRWLWRLRMTLIGVGYRRALAGWIETQPPELDCLEITAEHFFDGGEVRLRELAERYPLMVHGLGLSLGTPGPLDADVLSRFARVVKTANPLWDK